MYVIVISLYYCVYGLSAIVSMLVKRENSSLLAVVVCLFSAVFNYFGPTKNDAENWGINFIWEMSYSKWATEALYTEEVTPMSNIYNIDAAAFVYGY